MLLELQTDATIKVVIVELQVPKNNSPPPFIAVVMKRSVLNKENVYRLGKRGIETVHSLLRHPVKIIVNANTSCLQVHPKVRRVTISGAPAKCEQDLEKKAQLMEN